jgi:hypothetical protein
LDIAYYDKDLIHKIAEKTDLKPTFIERYQEKVATRQYPFVSVRTFSISLLMPDSKIQIAQSKIIK